MNRSDGIRQATPYHEHLRGRPMLIALAVSTKGTRFHLASSGLYLVGEVSHAGEGPYRVAEDETVGVHVGGVCSMLLDDRDGDDTGPKDSQVLVKKDADEVVEGVLVKAPHEWELAAVI